MTTDHPDNNRLKNSIISCFRNEGFEVAGSAQATFLSEESEKLNQWLANSYNAGMIWFANTQDKRTDPRKVLKGARTVFCGLINYYAPVPSANPAYKIARYAQGTDYHNVIMAKLNRIVAFIREQRPDNTCVAMVDSGTLMEKPWAQRCGLGWIGKNGLLINSKTGSFCFIGSIITDVEVEPDVPVEDHCGSCKLCMKACPNGALVKPGVVDAGRCIAYLTIEHKGEFESGTNTGNWLYGCDICQDVCPFNANVKKSRCAELMPDPLLREMTVTDWNNLSEEQFNRLFADSAVKRTGYRRFLRNIRNAST